MTQSENLNFMQHRLQTNATVLEVTQAMEAVNYAAVEVNTKTMDANAQIVTFNDSVSVALKPSLTPLAGWCPLPVHAVARPLAACARRGWRPLAACALLRCPELALTPLGWPSRRHTWLLAELLALWPAGPGPLLTQRPVDRDSPLQAVEENTAWLEQLLSAGEGFNAYAATARTVPALSTAHSCTRLTVACAMSVVQAHLT
jgi:hypothetical protein